MTDQEYEKMICSIPHLNLTPYLPKMDLECMQMELKLNAHNIAKFEYSRDVGESRMNYLQESWQGFILVDITRLGSHMIDYYTTNLTHDRIKSLGVSLKEDGLAEFQVTDIGEKMPYTTKYTTELFKDLCRIRVSKLTAERNISYHCHLAKARQNPNKIVTDESYRATIHIPLITNDHCYFAVTKDSGFSGHPDDFKLIDKQQEFKQKYGLNEIWMFNSVHYHKAVNNGRSNRYHLLIYFDFMDEKIRPVIEQAISNYQGPYID